MNPLRTSAGRLTCALLCCALLAGCAAPFTRVEQARTTVRERMEVDAVGDWNRYTPPGSRHREIWTRHGMPLDVLVFFTGVADGDPLNDAAARNDKLPRFRASMTPEDVVALTENLIAGNGGHFELQTLEPHTVAGRPGFGFDFHCTQRGEEIERAGSARGVIADERLWLMIYAAPRGRYVDEGRPDALRVMDSLQLKAQ